MTTFLYGLILSRNAIRLDSSVTGVAHSPVRTLDCGDLTALVSTVADAPERASLQDVQAHDAVLRHVVDSGVTAAAAKFGQRFRDDAACVADVRGRSERLAEVLERNDGCVEMRLLMHQGKPVAPPSAAAKPGTAYLEQLRASRNRGETLGVRGQLGPIVRGEAIDELPGNGLAIAHLVHRRDVTAYRDLVARTPQLSGARVVGPIALFAFANE
jgi:Gas vesicle synthesis protein GvpL/GvpF